jgi:hypothetical protein
VLLEPFDHPFGVRQNPFCRILIEFLGQRPEVFGIAIDFTLRNMNASVNDNSFFAYCYPGIIVRERLPFGDFDPRSILRT